MDVSAFVSRKEQDAAVENNGAARHGIGQLPLLTNATSFARKRTEEAGLGALVKVPLLVDLDSTATRSERTCSKLSKSRDFRAEERLLSIKAARARFC